MKTGKGSIQSDLCFLSSVFCPLTSVLCPLSSACRGVARPPSLEKVRRDKPERSRVICRLTSVLWQLKALIALCALFDQQGHRFDVIGVREQIDRLDFLGLVGRPQQVQIARQGGRIA